MLKLSIFSTDTALLTGIKQNISAMQVKPTLSVYSNVNAGFAHICGTSPDIILLDLTIPGQDPLTILEFFEDADFEKQPLLFALTNYVTPPLLNYAKNVVAYFFIRPIAPSVLLSQLLQIAETAHMPAPLRAGIHTTERIAARLLQKLGVSSHLQGYRFLLESVKLVCAAPNLTKLRVMGDIYPAVAQKCASSPMLVERGIRHAIASSWIFADITCLQSHFGYTVDAARDVPSNSAYIFTVAAHVLSRLQEQYVPISASDIPYGNPTYRTGPQNLPAKEREV